MLEWPSEDELSGQQPDTPEFRRSVEEQARGSLEGLVPAEVSALCKPETKVVRGKAYRQILETAEQQKSDLIVMGVRGRNALDLLLFGSTTNHVVRGAPCPVLTLRS